MHSSHRAPRHRKRAGLTSITTCLAWTQKILGVSLAMPAALYTAWHVGLDLFENSFVPIGGRSRVLRRAYVRSLHRCMSPLELSAVLQDSECSGQSARPYIGKPFHRCPELRRRGPCRLVVTGESSFPKVADPRPLRSSPSVAARHTWPLGRCPIRRSIGKGHVRCT